MRIKWLIFVHLVLELLVVGCSARLDVKPELTVTSPSHIPSRTITNTQTSSPMPTFTNTPTPTSRPTRRPTATLRTTTIPTATPTYAPIFTPEALTGDHTKDHLIPWTLNKAEEMIALMNHYPETLSDFNRGYLNNQYYYAFRFTAISQQEALLRFPDAANSRTWRWDLAFNLMQASDSSASYVYSNLLQESLTSKETTLEDLPGWVSQQQKHIGLQVIPLVHSEQYVQHALIDIYPSSQWSTTDNHWVSIFLWVVEFPDGYKIFPLESANLDWLGDGTEYKVLDLTGDGLDEIITIHMHQNGTLARWQDIDIFDVSQVPPQRILRTDSPLGDISQFKRDEKSGFSITSPMSYEVIPTCPIEWTQTYLWNGTQFEFLERQYDFRYLSEGFPYVCHFSLDRISRLGDYEAAIPVWENILANWPPPKDPYPIDSAPLDFYDEVNFRLAIYFAILGDSEIAIDYLNDILLNPAIPASKWIIPAQRFLNTYHTPKDLYRACIQAPICHPQHVLKRFVASLTSDTLFVVFDQLREYGVTLLGAGAYDFDQDGQIEKWITIRHRVGEPIELWILAIESGHLKALYVDDVELVTPSFIQVENVEVIFYSTATLIFGPIIMNEQRLTKEMFLIQYGTDRKFIYQSLKPNNEPEVFWIPPADFYCTGCQVFDALARARQALFTGADPIEVRGNLLEIQDMSVFKKNNYADSHAQLLYLLALTYELTGDERPAVNAYLELWRIYPDSPYTVMARMKLEKAP